MKLVVELAAALISGGVGGALSARRAIRRWALTQGLARGYAARFDAESSMTGRVDGVSLVANKRRLLAELRERKRSRR